MFPYAAMQKQLQTAMQKAGTYRKTPDSACPIESVRLR